MKLWASVGLAVVLLVASACGAADTDADESEPDQAVAVVETTQTDDTAGSEATASSTSPSTGSNAFTTCWQATPDGGEERVAFSDATADLGLVEPLTGMHAHAAAFGDVNGDGFVDLFAGTFANRSADKYAVRGATGPAPDRLILGSAEGFTGAAFPEAFGRTSGAVFADLDADGDEDLIASRNFKSGERADLATVAYENTGGGFVPVESAGLPVDFGGRSVAALHADDDGFLDLLIVEDQFVGGSSRLFRNGGDWTFTDVTAEAGLPTDVHGLGLAVGDVNNDGWADFFVGGSNRLFLSTGSGDFTESSDEFGWEPLGPEDDVAGAAFGDVDRDGWLDLVVGHHYNSTVSRDTEVAIRLYRNDQGRFVDVTEEAGLIPLPTKAPHVEFADFDNDGWLDILTSASAANGTMPAVFMNRDGAALAFESPVGLGSDQYWVTAPTADVNRDGRLDVLLLEWEPTLPSLLLLNDTQSGHWIEVKAPIGARVEVYRPGGVGDEMQLLGIADVVSSQGYASGRESVAHIGLGDVDLVDVRIRTGAENDMTTIPNIAADQRIAVSASC